jgi:hypothetical protein
MKPAELPVSPGNLAMRIAADQIDGTELRRESVEL